MTDNLQRDTSRRNILVWLLRAGTGAVTGGRRGCGKGEGMNNPEFKGVESDPFREDGIYG